MKRYRICDPHPAARCGYRRHAREVVALNARDAVRRYAKANGIKGMLEVSVIPVESGPVEWVVMHCSPQRRRRGYA